MTSLRTCAVLLFFLLMLGHCHPARADWGSAGAQVICQSSPAMFRVIPSDLSSADSPGAVHVLPGYQRLNEGDNRLSCHIGLYRLQAVIRVVPAENGQCEGAGVVIITSISADQVELTPDSPLLEWSCQDSEPSLVDVQVRMGDSGIALTRCYADLAADEPRPHQCKTESFDVKAIALANARIDHDLADSATQAASIATKLPAELDLTHLAGHEPAKAGAPACAHWGTGGATTHQYARIAGTAGERVYFQATYPLLCGRDHHDGCSSHGYVTPGDRVEVGFVCGDWTHVKYESRLRSVVDIVGWVPTRRLYAIDPVSAAWPDAQRPAGGDSSRYPSDSLEDAVWRGDTSSVVTLLGQMKRTPGSPLHAPCPLAIAVRRNNKDMVKTMLDLGVDPNEDDVSKGCDPPLVAAVSSGASTTLMELLLKAGADANGTGTPETPLIALIRHSQFRPENITADNARQLAINTSYDKAQLLLSHGANPNWKIQAGDTALLEAVRSNNIDLALLLLRKGADPDLETPLVDAIQGYSSGADPTLFVALLDHGANPNVRLYTRGMTNVYRETTPLIEAALAGNYTFVKLLLEHGAEPSTALDDGTSAMSIAVKSGHKDVLGLIKRYSKKD